MIPNARTAVNTVSMTQRAGIEVRVRMLRAKISVKIIRDPMASPK
jgi:hypothetical protein